MVRFCGASVKSPFSNTCFSGTPNKTKNRRRIMSEYKHGSMDISSQEKTFKGFIKGGIWLIGITFAVLVFLAVFNS
jgi:hypothetical protein